MREIYVSTDVETDGPIPGPHSMLSLGSAAFWPDKTIVSTFSLNLETLPSASGALSTMSWWRENPLAWDATRTHTQPPEQGMREYVHWLKKLPGKPIFVAYPAAYDFMWVYWYLIRFAGESPFGYSALDIKSYAMAAMKKRYRETSKHSMPKEWFGEHPHTHVALDDAIEQGVLFCSLLAFNA